MTYTLNNSGSYLKTSRTFPEESQMLSVEMSKSYIDIANAVNERTIGVFATVPSVTGNSWFIGKMSPTSNSLRQQTVRQVFLFTSAGSIAHGINTAQIGGFVAIYGTFTDGTNFYPLPYVDVNAANNQVNVYVSPTNIVITAGGGSPPTISSGFVVLEWLSQV